MYKFTCFLILNQKTLRLKAKEVGTIIVEHTVSNLKLNCSQLTTQDTEECLLEGEDGVAHGVVGEVRQQLVGEDKPPSGMQEESPVA